MINTADLPVRSKQHQEKMRNDEKCQVVTCCLSEPGDGEDGSLEVSGEK